ncbi:MAG TPA: protein-L-isoaspartate O-methyltransferase [Caulobacteraceae bacterium]|nr:protein-L-isoaspartate O-methyltransferase [Caulobacteraceae bacterium]
MSTPFAAQRATMVESQVRVADVTDYAIQDAMRLVPRETLLAPDRAYLAYADVELEYAPGRWLLKPRDVAKLLQALRPQAGERALAIAAPYAAAVMAAMGLEVYQLDAKAGELTFGDGVQGAVVPSGGYDVVVCEGAVGNAPPATWLQVLALGGRLGVVVRTGPIGRAELYLRSEHDIGRRDLFDCAPPIMAGFEPQAAFTF